MTDEQLVAAAWVWAGQFPDPERKWADLLNVTQAALAAAEQAAWSSDMSKAPKDGVEVDLWCEDGAGNARRCPDCAWEPMTDWMGNEFEGWYGVRDGYKPIAWRLPPEPPQ